MLCLIVTAMMPHTILVLMQDFGEFPFPEGDSSQLCRFLFVKHRDHLLGFLRGNPSAIQALMLPLKQEEDLELISQAKKISPQTQVIGLIESGKSAWVYRAFERGADELLDLPVSQDQLQRYLAKITFAKSKNRTVKIPSLRLGKMVRQLFRQPSKTLASVIPPPKPYMTSHPLEKSVQVVNPPSASETETDIQAKLLGKFSVRLHGEPLDLGTSRQRKSLLAFLLVNAHRKVSRDELMEAFWPDHTRESARNSLHVAVSNLRKLLRQEDSQQEYIRYHNECYQIDPQLSIETDVHLFLEHWKLGRQFENLQQNGKALEAYRTAAQHYGGKFLEENLYDRWADDERSHISEKYLFILDRISAYHSNNGTPHIALEYCHKILQYDNCREDIHRRSMRCYYRIGKREQAIRQYMNCQKILQEELKVPPTVETQKLFERIRKEEPDI